MPVPVADRVIEVQHDEDPKKLIWEDLKGWIDRIDPTSGDVVVCVYERPEKIKGSGIIIPATASRRSEDKFQGTVGLLVKIGPDFAKHKRDLALDPMPAIGDWVAFHNQDCHSFVLHNRAMRLLQGNHIRMVLQDPDCII